MTDISIREYLENPEKVSCNNFYDWFCRDTSLANKQKILDKKLAKIAKSPKINVDTMYAFYKNNCPVHGRLYDDFRICDLETGDVIYTITPSSGFYNKLNAAEVWGRENNFQVPIVSGTWKDVLKFFEL